MTGDYLLAPTTSALNIREEYQKDVEARLKSYGLEDDARNKIITDIYAKDDIYFSLNRPYEHIETSFAEFRKGRLHESLPGMLPFFREGNNLYTHQMQAIDSILNGQTTIISTGVGSGKTESFLIPILHHCLVQKDQDIPGIKAVILYPLNALANDQITRILKAVKGRGIKVGCFVGSTPPRKERKPSDQEEKCISRQEMIDNPPDILITNYVMLDRLITKPETRSMFVRSEQTLKYVVVDEVHYFRGTKGANLSLLLRRLRALCKQPLVQIGASGTLRQSRGYFSDSKQDSIEQFARLIFGSEAVTRNGFKLIKPAFKDSERAGQLDPLPATDDIKGSSLLNKLERARAENLYAQLSGKHEAGYHTGSGVEEYPMYHFALRSQFIANMREKLVEGACTFNELVELFRQLYRDTHHREPCNPKSVVEAYWSLINYLNQRCEEAQKPLILDYRLHLILGNIGDSLTRCLLCKQYHDGRCPRCRHCGNGLLFKVSKKDPNLCIGYFVGRELFPLTPSGRRKFDVLVQVSPEQPSESDVIHPRFVLEPNQDATTDEESYLLRPVRDKEDGIALLLPHNKQELETLPLSESRLYWHNILKVTDALVVRPETHTSDKLLGFIDNKERASSIKLRLNDEIAERTLTAWAASIWSVENEVNLLEAFDMLQKEIVASDEEEEIAPAAPLREMPFWFARMLTSLDEYEDWQVVVDTSLPMQPDEYELLNDILLREGAIDRTSFWTGEPASLKHFHLEKYRVVTQYGVGLSSAGERGYNIISLGEQGHLYGEFIKRMKSANIQRMLEDLTARRILVQKKTLSGLPFYQLHPKYIIIKASQGEEINTKTTTAPQEWKTNFATVECHTADHSADARTQIETRFSETKIQALICTPTLEMGVDIGKLLSVLMIGFPPSPANYAQRAGRAGRSNINRLATIVVLSSPEDAHDEYYYSLPRKMIDGAITPPQFTLTNFALLAAHVYAYFAGSTKSLSVLSNSVALGRRIQDFIEHDELRLRSELGKDYARFAEYLDKNSHTLSGCLKSREPVSMEDCYRQGVFPDYGFRCDGLPLLRHDIMSQRKEDEEDSLTAREPEEAPRKLVPGRIVFCGGRAVKVDANQPVHSYETRSDPTKKDFRLHSYVVADEKNEVQVEKRRDPDTCHRLSRFLDLRKPLETLEMEGPSYCRVYFVRQGTLFFINEGEVQQAGLQPLRDLKGDYRFGTCLERDGLLVRFADHILPSNMKADFLAVLLRGIPDYFDLDDSELRVAQNLHLYPQVEHESGKRTAFFIYGYDESGLVPFERIFEKLEDMLRAALRTLETCPCGGEGCYLCLFSLNSRSLTGRISRQGAIDSLSVYLRQSLLKPHITPAKGVMTQADITLIVSLHGNQCQVVVEHTMTGKREEYNRGNTEEDQNTRIYTALREALEREWSKGARTVKIRCTLDYICKQLQGENDIDNGREAFLNMWLTLLNWHDWQIERV